MKKKEQIINEYSDYSNEELVNKYLKRKGEYRRLIESEIIAGNILKKYGITYYYRHEEAKHNYYELIECLKIRGINPYKYTNNMVATLDDIIRRIEENCFYEVSKVDNNSYKYIGYLGGNSWNKELDIDGSDIKINEIGEEYSQIIDTVVGKYHDNKLVKSKIK